jgi:hypothetical protein
MKKQKTTIILRRISAFALVACAIVPMTNAQVVVPNEFASTPASTSGLNTFIRDLGNPRTGQLLINANQLTSLVGQQIGGISFRLFTGATLPFPAMDATWTDFTIRIGQGVAFGSQSTTFANNFVGLPTTVRTGPLTIAANSYPVAPGDPNPFGGQITFSLPFVYAGGNLLIEIRHTGSNITNNAANDFLEVALQTNPNYNVNYWSATATGNTATVGAQNNFTVTQLHVIPEPATALLLLVGGAGAWY